MTIERKDELKEIDLKNRTCYYFDDIIRVWKRDTAIDFNRISLDENLYKEKCENILIYDISYKVSTGAKPLRIRCDEIDGPIKIHNGIRYLMLFDCGWFKKNCDKIEYRMSETNGIKIYFNKELHT